MLILFFPVGLYGLWKSDQFGKKGKISLTLLVAFITLLASVEGEPPTETANISSGKIESALASATVKRETLHTIKLTYDITLPHAVILSLNTEEVETLLEKFLKEHREYKKFDRAFAVLFPEGVTQGFASLHYESDTKKVDISTDQWESYRCGLKTVMENEALFIDKIRWYCTQSQKTAMDFAVAYRDGKSVDAIVAQANDIAQEWENFLSANIGIECYATFPEPYGHAKTMASSLLLDMRGYEMGFVFNFFVERIEELNNVRI